MDGDARSVWPGGLARGRTRGRWPLDLLLAVVLAATLLPISVDMVRHGELVRGWAVTCCAAVAVLHLAVLFRGLVPVVAYTACAVAELALALAPHLFDPQSSASYPAVLVPSSAVYLVAAYSVSAAGRGAWPVLSLLGGLVGSLVVVVRAWASRSGSAVVDGGLTELLFLGGLLVSSVVAAWALGRFRRLRSEQLVALAERAQRAEEDRDRRHQQAVADERARIARELHDVIAHSVSVMVRQAEGGRYVATRDPAAAETALAAIADTGREALTDIRAMLGVLDGRPEPDALGPQPSVQDLPELVDRVRATGQPIGLRVEGEPRPLDNAADLAAYRLVQEALTNVVKHAGPRAVVEVVLTWSDRLLRLEVTDDGGGPPAGGGAPDGRGLVGMRQRLQLVGGRLAVGPSGSGGFAVVGEIPTATDERGAPA